MRRWVTCLSLMLAGSAWAAPQPDAADQDAVHLCFRKGHDKQQVKLQYAINKHGSVTDVKVSGQLDPAQAKCLRRGAASWSFERKHATKKATYAVVLRPLSKQKSTATQRRVVQREVARNGVFGPIKSFKSTNVADLFRKVREKKRAASAAKISIVRSRVRGRLDKKAAAKTLADEVPLLRKCDLRSAKRPRGLDGSVRLELEVSDSGRVLRVQSKSKAIKSPRVLTCLRRAAFDWRFVGKGKGAVAVDLKFTRP